jgi:hypothetical protein
MIANIGLVSNSKPLIGTVQEMVWARDIFYIPCISLTMGVENAYTTHPWIRECSSAIVETTKEAADLVKEFFLEY